MKWAIAASAALVAAGCSSAPAPLCDSSTCKPGNACLEGFDSFDAEVAGHLTIACRRSCSAQSDCPFDFHCTDAGTAKPTCVPDRHAYAPRDGQWGAPCSLGTCDVDQGFVCVGDTPDDPTALCTQVDCTDDGDCTGGYWCAVINDPQDTPLLTPGQPFTGNEPITPHTQRSVCLPRAWDFRPLTRCAPCTSDIDCPIDEGVTQHCTSSICARECSVDADCTFDAHCNDDGVCMPNAGECLADGAFGDPCRSDLDCVSGYCSRATYSNELFCTERVANPSVACAYGQLCASREGKLRSLSSAACVDLTKMGLGHQCVPTQNLAPYTVYAGFWSRAR